MANYNRNDYLRDLAKQWGVDPAELGLIEPRQEPVPSIEERVQRFWDDHPEVHVCMTNVDLDRGTFKAWERQENWPVAGPGELRQDFLHWLQTEMKYNPEWREHYGSKI